MSSTLHEISSQAPTDEKIVEVIRFACEQTYDAYGYPGRDLFASAVLDALRKAGFEVARKAWQPIESAPDGVEVLGIGRHGSYKIGKRFSAGVKPNALIDEKTGRFMVITHWQPLPEPPTE